MGLRGGKRKFKAPLSLPMDLRKPAC